MNKCKGFAEKEGNCKNNAMPKAVYCKNCAGRDFEDQISRIFTAQGYSVKSNITLNGTQNDLIAELSFGIARFRILIECKYKTKNEEAVSSGDVRKLLGSLENANRNGSFGKIDQAYLITNGSFSPQAKELAYNNNINLYTERDLIEHFMNFSPYLNSLVESYKKSELYNHYIELHVANSKRTINSYLDSFIAGNEEALVILGEYGSGKSSTCINLAYRLATKYLSNMESPLPILIELRNYNKAFDLDGLLTDMFVNKFGINNGSINAFKQLVQYGRIVLIFDGFDEIAQKVDKRIKQKVINEICKYGNGNTKIIVSCRPNYFQNRQEYNRVFSETNNYEPLKPTNLDFEEVFLGNLTKTQIRKYVESYRDKLKKNGMTVEEFFTNVAKIHDLTDLTSRPVLLNIILDTLPSMCSKNIGKINAASLYEEYTNKWIEREESKGKTIISSIDKRHFSEELAFDLYKHNRSNMGYEELPASIQLYFNKITDFSELDFIRHDIQSCSFLSVAEDGKFGFIHKSFMEYFLAIKIIKSLNEIFNKGTIRKDTLQSIEELLNGFDFTHEVGLFISDLLSGNTSLTRQLAELFSGNKKILFEKSSLNNLVLILSKIDFRLDNIIRFGVNFSEVILSNITLKDYSWNHICFDSANFYTSSISNCIFQDCSFSDCSFRKTRIDNVQFSDQDLSLADFSEAIVTDTFFKRANMSECKIKSTQFINCDFEDCDMSMVEYDSNTLFKGCTDLETVLGLPYDICCED